MSQQNLAAPRRASAAEGPRVPGEPAVWIFFLTEMGIFAALFGVILWYRAHDPQMFQDGQALLSQPLGLLNTVVLIIGSVVVVLAIDAVGRDCHRQAARYLATAIGLGFCFVAVKAVEYASVIGHGGWIHTNAFWMVFFAITGAHLVHVLVGTATLGLMLRPTAGGLVGPRDRDLFVSATCYWHLVDMVWLVLFPLFYLVN